MTTKNSTTKVRDISKLIKKEHENQWVALSPDYRRVISSGKTLKDTAAKIKEGEKNKVIFHKVLPFEAYYEPSLV